MFHILATSMMVASGCYVPMTPDTPAPKRRSALARLMRRMRSQG
jgi:hypothetical protein